MERKLNSKNNSGFTLVELMVVVAIIGILATLAVPQYKKFQAKSRQSEARLSLGGAYTIEQSFAAENSSYTLCLGQAGYNRDGVRFYYALGFGSAMNSVTTCGPSGALSCAHTAWQFDPNTQTYANQASAICTPANANMAIFPATAGENSSLTLSTASTAQGFETNGSFTTHISQQFFTIGAAGSILTAAGTTTLTNPYDGWTIDQNKQLRNTRSGLF